MFLLKISTSSYTYLKPRAGCFFLNCQCNPLWIYILFGESLQAEQAGHTSEKSTPGYRLRSTLALERLSQGLQPRCSRQPCSASVVSRTSKASRNQSTALFMLYHLPSQLSLTSDEEALCHDRYKVIRAHACELLLGKPARMRQQLQRFIIALPEDQMVGCQEQSLPHVR